MPVFHNEYFEEDIKTENDDKGKQNEKLSIHFCNICQKEYKSKASLSIHTISVHKEKRLPCNQCGKQFTEQGSLKKHTKSVHVKVKYPCDQCGKQFTRQDSLKTHLQSVHEKVKYPCNLCDNFHIKLL